MNILVLTRYGDLGASSRYRSFQFFPFLNDNGIFPHVEPLLDNHYLESKYAAHQPSIFKIATAYIRRITTLLKSNQFDIVWVEKELLPWAPGWFERLMLDSGPPLILDYDDAIFHNYDLHTSPIVRHFYGRKIDSLMRSSDLVTAGNAYLSKRALDAGAPQVEILPTVIDLERYRNPISPCNERFTIGWIGSPSTTQYLKALHPALRELCRDGSTELVAIGATPFELEGVPIRCLPWSEATEVRDLQTFDVGIMPLPDEPWTRGKCGFKLIQYMACGTPVVGSPIGVNSEIIEEGQNGYQALTLDDWIRALRTLKEDQALRHKLGAEGRKKVEREYCVQVVAPKLVALLQTIAGRVRTPN